MIRQVTLCFRKYRILDDCSRMRDIISSLPEDRHFVPAILIVVWADGGSKGSPKDFLEMVCGLTLSL